MVSGVHTVNENHGVEMIWLNFTNLQTVENYCFNTSKFDKKNISDL